MTKLNSLIVACSILIGGTLFSCTQGQSASVGEKMFLKDFQMKYSGLVEAGGESVSTGDFTPQDWYPVTVPCTVLSGLVQNGVYPDPHFGMNNMRIPDANEEFSERYHLAQYSYLPDKSNPWEKPYWFRTSFRLPRSDAGRQIRLNFEGINYRADVWLNGRQVAAADSMVGMFKQFTLNVTDQAVTGGTNYLAVRIHPLDYPGMPAPPQTEVLGPFGPNGGPTGDIGKNVTMQCSVGWDWLPAVRDRNMGIWQDVYVTTTGPVDIRFPKVVTDLPLPDTSPATITVSAELYNPTGRAASGSLRVALVPHNFDGNTVRVAREVTVSSQQNLTVTFLPDEFSALTLPNPRLWWPNTYGPQNLYDLVLSFTSQGQVLDRDTTLFGIREIDSKVTVVNGWNRRDFYVNGRRIQIKGGAWAPDMTLSRTPEKYKNELRLSREANFNMVRLWGGGATPPEEFFRDCDEYGLLVWHDFWITGDCQGTFGKGTRDWPLQGAVFLSNARNTVKRLRNHPSLLTWTAGNEGYPRKDLYQALRNDIVAKLDGTRPFLPTSGYANPAPSWGLSWPDNHETGAYSGGPYAYVPPEQYYTLVARGRDWLFKDEVGLPSVPPASILKRFIPDLEPDPQKPFPLNNIWGYHDACEGNGKYSVYDQAIRGRYGRPGSLEDYAEKAQFVNAENYRAIFEAVNSRLNGTGGVILWKTAPAWPSVIWQVYDWYLRPNAGFYYAKKACEPVHVQLNLDTQMVTVINTTDETLENLTVKADVYDETMLPLSTEGQQATVGASTAKEIFPLEIVYQPHSIRFVRLTLTDSSGRTRSSNFYWLSETGDFTALNNLPDVELVAATHTRQTADQFQVIVELTNPSDNLAFFVNPRITKGDGGEEALPTYWSDNYFSILPGESKTIHAEVGLKYLEGQAPYLSLGGWNVQPKEIEF